MTDTAERPRRHGREGQPRHGLVSWTSFGMLAAVGLTVVSRVTTSAAHDAERDGVRLSVRTQSHHVHSARHHTAATHKHTSVVVHAHHSAPKSILSGATTSTIPPSTTTTTSAAPRHDDHPTTDDDVNARSLELLGTASLPERRRHVDPVLLGNRRRRDADHLVGWRGTRRFSALSRSPRLRLRDTRHFDLDRRIAWHLCRRRRPRTRNPLTSRVHDHGPHLRQ